MGATTNTHPRRYDLSAQHDQHIKVKVNAMDCSIVGVILHFSSNVAYVWDVGNCTNYMAKIRHKLDCGS
jgi:hypothetical protein